MKKTSMTFEEYRHKQMAIQQQISNYYIDNCNKQIEIETNNREIAKLEWQLKDLHQEFLEQNKVEE